MPKTQKTSKVNAATDEAGLTFNVISYRKYMREHYVKRNIQFETKNEDDEVVRKPPMISGGHIAVTAVVQALSNYILTRVKTRVREDKTGLRRLDRYTLRSFVLEGDKNLSTFFLPFESSFSSSRNYDSGYPVSNKELNAFVEKTIGTNLMLTEKCYNYLYFLLSEVTNQLIDNARHFMDYAGHRSIKYQAVKQTVKVLFTETLSKYLNIALDKAVKNGKDGAEVDDEVEDHNDEEEDVLSEDDSEDEVEVEQEKSKDKKKDKKKGKKGKKEKHEEVDEDEEDEEDEEVVEDVLSDVESDEEPDEEPEKPKKSSTKKGKGKGKNKSRSS
tara:strand:+ start:152952 stop:153938 length:987 start_codon:yes stop_codon:yes gene_type:complete